MYMMEDSRPFHERLYNDPATERRKKEAERAKERTLRKSKIHELGQPGVEVEVEKRHFNLYTHTLELEYIVLLEGESRDLTFSSLFSHHSHSHLNSLPLFPLSPSSYLVLPPPSQVARSSRPWRRRRPRQRARRRRTGAW